MHRIFLLFLTAVICLLLITPPVVAAEKKTTEIPTIPVPGMVTMVDLGAEKCIPCKMMAPIIEELQKEYNGLAAVVFIDVRKNPDQGKRFAVKAIPTQIFYDRDGKEVSRHMGFMGKKSILEIFEKHGVTKEKTK